MLVFIGEFAGNPFHAGTITAANADWRYPGTISVPPIIDSTGHVPSKWPRLGTLFPPDESQLAANFLAVHIACQW
jgi:hypothetical protein